MPPLREIPGPAGRLEVLLDEPMPRGVGPDGLVNSGTTAGLRAAVVLGHPHTNLFAFGRRNPPLTLQLAPGPVEALWPN